MHVFVTVVFMLKKTMCFCMPKTNKKGPHKKQLTFVTVFDLLHNLNLILTNQAYIAYLIKH